MRNLLDDVDAHVKTPVSALVTINVPETEPFSAGDFRFPVEIIRNRSPKGFGANHNAAFTRVTGPHFCILI